jgi:membrane fusion protein (multidrug efflux system)
MPSDFDRQLDYPLLSPAALRQRFGRALAVVLLPVLLASCGDTKPAQGTATPPPKVRLATVTEMDVPIIMDFPGTVQAYRQVTIVPRVSGAIMKRYFEEGAFVKEDDLLYLIDPRPFEAEVASAQGQLQRDQAEVAFWQKEADRYARLAARGAGSVENKEKADSTLAEYQAAVAVDQGNLDDAKLNLTYTKIRAPFPGRIDNTLNYEGDLVTAQQTALTDLVQLDPIHVVFKVSRARMAEVQKLQAEGLAPKGLKNFKARLILPDGSIFDQEGYLDFMSNTVDPRTDSVTLRAVFRNPVQTEPGLVLIPGQYVPIHVVVGQRPNALVIPQQAVLRTQAGLHVLVVGQDDKAESRPVTIVDSYNNHFVIGSGLAKGERVIVEGLQGTRVGHPVEPIAGDPAKQTPQG